MNAPAVTPAKSSEPTRSAAVALCSSQEHYETNIAPFEGQYDNMVSGIGDIFLNACDRHAKGVDMLKKEFDYHPSYKKHSDRFSAVPFKPGT